MYKSVDPHRSLKFNMRTLLTSFSIHSDSEASLPQDLITSNMSLEENFKTVADKVRNWKTKPSDDENLALYSLYKQAVFGDVNISEPSGIIEKAKFKAWTSRKGISQDDAKKQYVELAEKLHSKYA